MGAGNSTLNTQQNNEQYAVLALQQAVQDAEQHQPKSIRTHVLKIVAHPQYTQTGEILAWQYIINDELGIVANSLYTFVGPASAVYAGKMHVDTRFSTRTPDSPYVPVELRHGTGQLLTKITGLVMERRLPPELSPLEQQIEDLLQQVQTLNTQAKQEESDSDEVREQE